VAETPTDKAGDGAETGSIDEGTAAGKGRATPTRREKEAARKRPLVPNDRAEAKKQSRATMQAQRERARIGMANGEERYLPSRDRGPQRKYIRDYIDARFSIGEVLLPVMFMVVIISFFPQPEVAVLSFVVLYAFLVLAVLDAVLLGFTLKRKLSAKFGESRLESGYRWYAAMRAFQLRAMRLPKPQVRRRQFPA